MKTLNVLLNSAMPEIAMNRVRPVVRAVVRRDWKLAKVEVKSLQYMLMYTPGVSEELLKGVAKVRLYINEKAAPR